MAMSEYWYLWLLVALAWVATDMWRLLGLLLADRIAADSLAMKWINAVAYAMVCGVMMQVVVYSPGILADTPLVARLAGLGVSVGLMVWRGSIPLAVAGGAGGFFVVESLLVA
ncbi:MAG: AzlD domain-containing protein [Proteobacteria bacterium]|nr:AzlD domain-containing protein [Pseudomonadota bacterium]